MIFTERTLFVEVRLNVNNKMDKTIDKNYKFNELGYEHRLLLFADALGFSDYSSKPKNFNTVKKIIDDLRNIGNTSSYIKTYLPIEMKGISGLYEYSLLSDTLLISCPLALIQSEEITLEVIVDFFTDIFGIISTCDINFPLFRGTLVSGLVYHKDGIVFGPALIDAYKFRTECCKVSKNHHCQRT